MCHVVTVTSVSSRMELDSVNNGAEHISNPNIEKLSLGSNKIRRENKQKRTICQSQFTGHQQSYRVSSSSGSNLAFNRAQHLSKAKTTPIGPCSDVFYQII
jgi:hypothetical protein